MADQQEFTIGDVSNEVSLPESTIRYYDREFADYLAIERDKNNQRIFTEQNIKDLEYIRYLLKRENYTVEQVKKKLAAESELKDRQDQLEEEPADNSGAEFSQEFLENLSEIFENFESRLERIEAQLEEFATGQAELKSLLDMNLQRYNKLVEKLF